MVFGVLKNNGGLHGRGILKNGQARARHNDTKWSQASRGWAASLGKIPRAFASDGSQNTAWRGRRIIRREGAPTQRPGPIRMICGRPTSLHSGVFFGSGWCSSRWFPCGSLHCFPGSEVPPDGLIWFLRVWLPLTHCCPFPRLCVSTLPHRGLPWILRVWIFRIPSYVLH